MTSSIPLSDLPEPDDEIRRDRWGRYLVVPLGGGTPKGYTRVTTVAKALDNGGGLAAWKSAMTVCGVIKRRGLRSQWEALINQHDGDPWYSGVHGKAACKSLVEECAAAGGSNERRDTGTSLHALTALIDVGRPPTHLTTETERDLVGYVQTMRHAGITVVEHMVEVTVVLDDYEVAGTFDRAVLVPGFDLPLIADLKCGADLSYSWQSIAVQLAAYSRANAIYRQGPADDGSQDERLPMPAVDQDNGLIIWLDAGTGNCELFLIDLAAGWQAFERSMWVREWRKTKVSMPYDGQSRWSSDDLVATLEASVAQVGGGPSEDAGSPSAAATTTDFAEDSTEYTDEIRAWLQARIDAIGAHDQARIDLGHSWPAGLPGLLASNDHTPEQLQAIEDVLRIVERRHRIVFPEPKPGVDLLAEVLNIFPNAVDVTNAKESKP